MFNAYVDLQDGPSGIQKRPNVPTMMERNEFAKTIYETERDNHTNQSPKKLEALASARSKLYESLAGLRTPNENRQEIIEIRNQLKEYNGFKTEHMFLGKRDRLMKSAWRHGVFGVDDADAFKT